jgi:hypothetical protein
MHSANLKSEGHNIEERELRDILVGTVITLRGGRPEIRASISGNNQRFISSSQRPVQLWHRSFLTIFNSGSFSELKVAGA